MHADRASRVVGRRGVPMACRRPGGSAGLLDSRGDSGAAWDEKRKRGTGPARLLFRCPAGARTARASATRDRWNEQTSAPGRQEHHRKPPRETHHSDQAKLSDETVVAFHSSRASFFEAYCTSDGSLSGSRSLYLVRAAPVIGVPATARSRVSFHPFAARALAGRRLDVVAAV